LLPEKSPTHLQSTPHDKRPPNQKNDTYVTKHPSLLSISPPNIPAHSLYVTASSTASSRRGHGHPQNITPFPAMFVSLPRRPLRSLVSPCERTAAVAANQCGGTGGQEASRACAQGLLHRSRDDPSVGPARTRPEGDSRALHCSAAVPKPLHRGHGRPLRSKEIGIPPGLHPGAPSSIPRRSHSRTREDAARRRLASPAAPLCRSLFAAATVVRCAVRKWGFRRAICS
jgi:hypothetical protein